MRKFAVILSSITLLIMSSVVWAAAVNGSNVNKVGVIDMRQVMEKSSQMTQIRNSLRKDFQPREQKIISAQNTLKEDMTKLHRDAAIMNANDRKVLEQKVSTEQQDLQKLQRSFQDDLMAAQNKSLRGFLVTLKEAVAKVARDESLSLVITKDVVAYMQDTMDVTDKVLQKLH